MSESEEPKIIVDEDWKSQVEQEREQLKAAESEQPAPGADAMQMPPATFPVLLATLGSQAMSLLGLLPGPDGKADPSQVNLPIAKHMIDLISMLEEKTKGNLDQEEAGMLSENLHQLRMAYVAVSRNPPAPATPADNTDNSPNLASKEPTIELP